MSLFPSKNLRCLLLATIKNEEKESSTAFQRFVHNKLFEPQLFKIIHQFHQEPREYLLPYTVNDAIVFSGGEHFIGKDSIDGQETFGYNQLQEKEFTFVFTRKGVLASSSDHQYLIGADEKNLRIHSPGSWSAVAIDDVNITPQITCDLQRNQIFITTGTLPLNLTVYNLTGEFVRPHCVPLNDITHLHTFKKYLLTGSISKLCIWNLNKEYLNFENTHRFPFKLGHFLVHPRTQELIVCNLTENSVLAYSYFTKLTLPQPRKLIVLSSPPTTLSVDFGNGCLFAFQAPNKMTLIPYRSL